ncbi:hypothetical protein JCM11641_000383 [Rhodosporidiobolus odoratus]
MSYQPQDPSRRGGAASGRPEDPLNNVASESLSRMKPLLESMRDQWPSETSPMRKGFAKLIGLNNLGLIALEKLEKQQTELEDAYAENTLPLLLPALLHFIANDLDKKNVLNMAMQPEHLPDFQDIEHLEQDRNLTPRVNGLFMRQAVVLDRWIPGLRAAGERFVTSPKGLNPKMWDDNGKPIGGATVDSTILEPMRRTKPSKGSHSRRQNALAQREYQARRLDLSNSASGNYPEDQRGRLSRPSSEDDTGSGSEEGEITEPPALRAPQTTPSVFKSHRQSPSAHIPARFRHTAQDVNELIEEEARRASEREAAVAAGRRRRDNTSGSDGSARPLRDSRVYKPNRGDNGSWRRDTGDSSRYGGPQ